MSAPFMGRAPVLEIGDDTYLLFGDDSDCFIGYDEAFSNALVIGNNATATAGAEGAISVLGYMGLSDYAGGPLNLGTTVSNKAFQASGEVDSTAASNTALAVIRAVADNSGGTALTTGSLKAYEAAVIGHTDDAATADYYAFHAGNASDGGGDGVFAALQVGTGWDASVKIGSGLFDFDGSDIDLDPTGDFTIDMDADKAVTLTLSDDFATALAVKVGSDNYLVIDSTDGSEVMTFGNATTDPDFSFLGTGGIGFFGATPAPKPDISGSRGGNAALADLLTELATLGLIADSSS